MNMWNKFKQELKDWLENSKKMQYGFEAEVAEYYNARESMLEAIIDRMEEIEKETNIH